MLVEYFCAFEITSFLFCVFWVEYLEEVSILKPQIWVFLCFRAMSAIVFVLIIYVPLIFYTSSQMRFMCLSDPICLPYLSYWLCPFSSPFYFLTLSSQVYTFGIVLFCFVFFYFHLPSGSTSNFTMALFVFLNIFLNSLSPSFASISYHIASFFLQFCPISLECIQQFCLKLFLVSRR